MKRFYINLLFFTFFLLNSCRLLDSKDYLVANSAWFIDSLSVNGEDVKYLLMGNAMIFEEEDCSIPLNQKGMKKGDDKGDWSVDEENRTITIVSKNEYFNGTFKYCFKENKEDSVIELYMVSESIGISAHSPNKLESGLIDIPFSCNEE